MGWIRSRVSVGRSGRHRARFRVRVKGSGRGRAKARARIDFRAGLIWTPN